MNNFPESCGSADAGSSLPNQVFGDALQVAGQLILPLILCSFLASLLGLLLAVPAKGWTRQCQLRANMAFAIFGGTMGLLVGGSKTSTLSSVLPALITLITVYLGYSVQKEGNEDLKHISPALVFSLLVSSAFMAFYAAASTS